MPQITTLERKYLKSDVDSQLDSQLELNNQLTVAKGPFRSAPTPISIILTIPPHLVSMRQLVFALDA